MQTYTKLYHKRFPLWKKINRKMGKEAKIIYLYLLSSPFTHHSGLFEYNETMLVNTGLTFDEIEIGVSELLANRLITVDEQLEYCLITYLVENIKLDNPNQAKSLVNYLLDLEKTFLLGIFHQLIENTDTFNRIETVEEGLFNRYQTVVEPFANKDNTLYIKDNTLNNKHDTVEIIEETVSEETLVVLDKPKKTRKDEAYYFKYLQIWYDFLDLNNNAFELVRTTKSGFKNMIDEIKKFEKKGLTLTVYQEALQESQDNSFLFGDNQRSWKMDILFLMKKESRAKLYAGKYKGSRQRQSQKGFNSIIDNKIDDVVGAPF